MSEKIAILYVQAKHGGKSVAIAEDIYDDLVEFLGANKRYLKKFNYICQLIAEGKTNKKIYGPEDFDEYTKSAGVHAIKIKQGKNPRIYCREMDGLSNDSSIVVVAASLHASKKNQKLKAKEKSRIKAAADTHIDRLITEEEYEKEQTENDAK